MMKRQIVGLLLVLGVLSAAPSLGASCVWPDYENTERVWGRLVSLQSTTSNGQPWVAFTLRAWKPSDTSTPTGASIRVECGTSAVSLGCDQFLTGDSVLLSGHLVEYASCRIDGADDYVVPNVLYRCTDHLSGSCHQITPCS
jgi:hypothetical protein